MQIAKYPILCLLAQTFFSLSQARYLRINNIKLYHDNGYIYSNYPACHDNQWFQFKTNQDNLIWGTTENPISVGWADHMWCSDHGVAETNLNFNCKGNLTGSSSVSGWTSQDSQVHILDCDCPSITNGSYTFYYDLQGGYSTENVLQSAAFKFTEIMTGMTWLRHINFLKKTIAHYSLHYDVHVIEQQIPLEKFDYHLTGEDLQVHKQIENSTSEEQN